MHTRGAVVDGRIEYDGLATHSYLLQSTFRATVVTQVKLICSPIELPIERVLAGAAPRQDIVPRRRCAARDPPGSIFQDTQQESGIHAVAVGNELDDRRAGHRLALYLFGIAQQMAVEGCQKLSKIEIGRCRAIDQLAIWNDLEVRSKRQFDWFTGDDELLADIDDVRVIQVIEGDQVLDSSAVLLGDDTQGFACVDGVALAVRRHPMPKLLRDGERRALADRRIGATVCLVGRDWRSHFLPGSHGRGDSAGDGNH